MFIFLLTRAILVVFNIVDMYRPVCLSSCLTHVKLTIIVDEDELSSATTIVPVADVYSSIKVFANASPMSYVLSIKFAIVVGWLSTLVSELDVFAGNTFGHAFSHL